MVICGNWAVLPPHWEYITLLLVPHDVADCANSWFGHDGPGTDVNILLKTAKFSASVRLPCGLHQKSYHTHWMPECAFRYSLIASSCVPSSGFSRPTA